MLVAQFVPKKKRSRLWRKTAISIVKTALFVGGVRVHASETLRELRRGNKNFIYASNHPSELDGLVLQAFFGPEVIPFTAPLAGFNHVISIWLHRMGAVEVLRDDIDKKRFPRGQTKHEALHLALKLINDGHSLLIFPEGHTEHIEALYRFHTGAARLSHASGITIQPLVLKDAHIVFSNMFVETSGIITIGHGKQIIPEKAHGSDLLFTGIEELRAMVRQTTHELEEDVLSHLPLRLTKEQRPAATNVAAFVDIDMTLYHGLSQVDFVIELVRQKEIPISHGFYIGYLFILERLHILEHEQLMRRSNLRQQSFFIIHCTWSSYFC